MRLINMRKIVLILILLVFPFFSFAGNDTWGFTTSEKDGIIINTGGGTNTGIDILNTETDIVVSQGGGVATGQSNLKNCPDRPEGSVANVFNYATCLISKSLIPLVIGIAFIFFVWNAINYIKSAEKSEKRVEAAEYMLWSVVAFTVMLTVFGIVGIILNTINGI